MYYRFASNMFGPSQRRRIPFLLVLSVLLLLPPVAFSATVVRHPFESGMFAAIHGGRSIFLECRPPRGKAAQAFFEPVLKEKGKWKDYEDRVAVAIPLYHLNTDTQLRVLKTLFPNDRQDNTGWWHSVTYSGAQGNETWWSVAEWFTGRGTQQDALKRIEENRDLGDSLVSGYRILIPRKLLIEAFRAPLTPDPPPPLAPAPAPLDVAVSEPEAEMGIGDSEDVLNADENPEDLLEPMLFRGADGELTYGVDSQGEYAAYRLKKSEAIYSNVVLRFTGAVGHNDVVSKANEILARNGITDARNIDAGHPIKIPLKLLTDRYQPPGSAARARFASVRDEVSAVRESRKKVRDLEGVVIVLDPGHGGRDQGTANLSEGLFEDELTYDIVCRIKLLLETETKAKVYVTQKDASQGYRVSNDKRFVHDTDEFLLTTPHYPNELSSTVSANMRWYLTNDIYREEIARGTREENMLFASIHCNNLYAKLRGTMVFIPGATYRKDRESPPPGSIYSRYKESSKHRAISTTSELRRRDEIRSYEFAETLIGALRKGDAKIKVFENDPIRRYIDRNGRRILPAVLRNTLIPTKVLVETANLGNATDSQRLADPQWRQWFAEAFVDAVKEHYKS